MNASRWCGIVLIATLCAGGPRAHAATPEQIEQAIQKGCDYLYSQQNAAGNWEVDNNPPSHEGEGGGMNLGQKGGRTAIALYALLAAGQTALDPRIVKATEWLRQYPIAGHYALGLRANVWLNLPATPQNLASLRQDGKTLVNDVGAPGTPFAGLYNYATWQKTHYVDLSCSQYGVLGAWAAAQRLSGSISPQYWTLVEQAWRKWQQPDGGWAYNGTPKDFFTTTIQITAAGVATLFITQDYLHAGDGIDGTRGNISDPYITKGLQFIAQKFPALVKTPMPYAMYGIERIGVASGYKYLGDDDWFSEGADAFVRLQTKEGAFGWVENAVPDTAFAVLFLSRGRAPVMMNKLQYDIGDKEANWNQRPRDLANITKWVDEKIERRLNWQIIDLKRPDPLRDLHDSNILYISGNQSIDFTPPQQALLRQYVEEGGLIIGTADASKAAFAKGFHDLGKALFPDYEFKTLDEKTPSPLMTGEQFPVSQWKKKLRVEGLGNHARYFMILLPDADVGKTFQRQDANHPEPYQFFANLFLYSIDKTDARFKGDTHIIRPDPTIQPTKTITVARLKYDGHWNPEPGGWKRLAAVMNNQDKIRLDVKTVELGKDSLQGIQIAHLTGAEKFSLTNGQRDAIIRFVQTGGLLVIDSCGGTDEFNASAQLELSKMFPQQAPQLAVPLKSDAPVYTLAQLPPVGYRNYAIVNRPEGAQRYRLDGMVIDGKLGILYSPDDLSVALVGQSVDGITGYKPNVVTALMSQILMLKDAGKI